MGKLHIHIYRYNKEHVIVYKVIEDTQSECGQPRHRFQKSPFSTLKTQSSVNDYASLVNKQHCSYEL